MTVRSKKQRDNKARQTTNKKMAMKWSVLKKCDMNKDVWCLDDDIMKEMGLTEEGFDVHEFVEEIDKRSTRESEWFIEGEDYMFVKKDSKGKWYQVNSFDDMEGMHVIISHNWLNWAILGMEDEGDSEDEEDDESEEEEEEESEELKKAKEKAEKEAEKERKKEEAAKKKEEAAKKKAEKELEKAQKAAEKAAEKAKKLAEKGK